MTPAQALALREELCRWYGSPAAIAYYEMDNARAKLDDMRAQLTPEQVSELHHRISKDAPVFIVAEHMRALIDEAAKTLPRIEKMGPADLPTPTGLMFFEGPPLEKVTLDTDEIQDVIAVMWSGTLAKDVSGQVRAGVEIRMFEDRDGGTFPGPAIDQEQFREHARRVYPRLIDVNQLVVTFGENPDGEDVVTEADRSWTGPIFRKVMATWMLVRQTLVHVERQSVDRASLRRANRAEMATEVSVIRLRRMKQEHRDDEAGFVEWSCRWLVRGHWRQQWVPSQGVHRPTWIAPHVKGPEHLPLRLTEKVSVFNR